MVDRPRCRTCKHWSEWLADYGDCMEYAHRRRIALGGDANPEDWPVVAAQSTSGASSCPSHAPEETT